MVAIQRTSGRISGWGYRAAEGLLPADPASSPGGAPRAPTGRAAALRSPGERIAAPFYGEGDALAGRTIASVFDSKA